MRYMILAVTMTLLLASLFVAGTVAKADTPWYAKPEYWDHEITQSELKRRVKGLSRGDLQDIAICARLSIVLHQDTKQPEFLDLWNGLALFLAVGAAENGHDPSVIKSLNTVAIQEIESMTRYKNKNKAAEIQNKCTPLMTIGMRVFILSQK